MAKTDLIQILQLFFFSCSVLPHEAESETDFGFSFGEHLRRVRLTKRRTGGNPAVPRQRSLRKKGFPADGSMFVVRLIGGAMRMAWLRLTEK